MKNLFLALGLVVVLASCGGGAPEAVAPAVDSAAVAVDTTAVASNTAAIATADTTK